MVLKNKRVDELQECGRNHFSRIEFLMHRINRGIKMCRNLSADDPRRKELWTILKTLTKTKCPRMLTNYRYQFNYFLLNGEYLKPKQTINCKWCYNSRITRRASKNYLRRIKLNQ